MSGITITVKRRRATRKESPILVVAPHGTFLDSLIVYLTDLSSVTVRMESRDNFIGSKWLEDRLGNRP